ncbi:UNVERIFIED_CONTAM: AGZA family xanthine/uracil permease-like MFS transporter [Acetivibrio alkalicellulosi]
MDKFFKLKENNTDIKTELIAGLTTFVTMAYIIFVNPDILSAPFFIMDNPEYGSIIFNNVFFATCVAAAIGTLIMALYAKLPFAQAPGMGLNAFFSFTMVFSLGYTFNQALAAVFISGILFIIITLIGFRKTIVKAIPENLKYAISAGIGLFIALIGFSNANIIIAHNETLVTMIDFSNFQSPEVKNALVAVIGLMIIAILMQLKIKGAILIGILLTTIISIPFGVANISITGINDFISLPQFPRETFMKMDIRGLLGIGTGQSIWSILFTTITLVVAFSLVDMFDTIGALIGTGQQSGLVDKDGNLPNMEKALMADAIATTTGAILGTSTVTTYIESGAGIQAGGKTGLTSVVTAIMFLLALFFAPLVGIVPPAATAPALIIVGILMISQIKNINFESMDEALPAFLTIVLMPFTYSIATGIAAGIITYPVLKFFKGKSKEVHPILYVLAILFIMRFILMPH